MKYEALKGIAMAAAVGMGAAACEGSNYDPNAPYRPPVDLTLDCDSKAQAELPADSRDPLYIGLGETTHFLKLTDTYGYADTGCLYNGQSASPVKCQETDYEAPILEFQDPAGTSSIDIQVRPFNRNIVRAARFCPKPTATVFR